MGRPGAGGKAARRNGSNPDVAEQLVVQVQKWFETLAAQGKMPRVFTGITREPRQLIIELDSLQFDDAQRRDFLIWLSRKYRAGCVCLCHARDETAGARRPR